MTINTVLEQMKNYVAPEVKVEQSVSLAATAGNWFDLMNELADAFQLEFLEDNGRSCRFRFPGSPIIELSQVKVIWGGTPDEAPYHGLQAYVQVDRLEEDTLRVKLYERFCGARSEQRVYHHVLTQRLEKMIDFLRKQ